jgi:hypothetical protein
VPRAEQAKTTERRSRRCAARGVLIVALAGLVTMVQGCREEEQNRPLAFDKGTYQGQANEELGQDQLDTLRQRAARQRM